MSNSAPTPPVEVAPRAVQQAVPRAREIDVELLALDLAACTRCVNTLANIEEAIEAVRQVLDVAGTEVGVHKILVKSEEQARRHRFATSPTIRINGRDIAAETLESHCDSCTNLCGCDEGTSCRVWRYQGQEYAEAPVGLVVEAILRETYGGTNRTVSDPVAYEGVPENLRRFFTGKSVEETVTASSCCTPGEQEVCCEASAKSSCCGTAEVGTCGCQQGAGLP
jgi:hypothetical protein